MNNWLFYIWVNLICDGVFAREWSIKVCVSRLHVSLNIPAIPELISCIFFIYIFRENVLSGKITIMFESEKQIMKDSGYHYYNQRAFQINWVPIRSQVIHIDIKRLL